MGRPRKVQEEITSTKRVRGSSRRAVKEEVLTVKPPTKEKFSVDVAKKLGEFKLTPKQQEMRDVINANTLSFVEAPAGTGKTSAILYDFCKEYLVDPTKKIVVVRTPVEAASMDKIGFLPDDLNAKIEPHFESTKKILVDFLGAGRVECDLDHRIFFKIPNYMVGCTIDNALVLVDEGQLLQPMIMKLILERIGQGSRVVVAGDVSQIYANEKEANLRNGLGDALMRFFTRDMEAKYDSVGYFSFDVDDVQRSDIVKSVIRAYRNE